MQKKTVDFLASFDIIVLNGYGMTETNGAISISSLTKKSQYAAGIPVEGTGVMIDSKNGDEIIVRGRHVMMGYLNNEKATLETFNNKAYLRTGDIGKMEPEGFIYINGRIKELIVTSGGENIAPVIIEDQLKLNCPILNNAMVVGDLRKYLTVLLTLKVEVNMQTGEPTTKLLPEAQQFLQNHLGLTLYSV